MARENRREAMLDAAEGLARTRGYHGLSVRDVADAVGVKSAAVFYHFPTKADLGQAVAERYTKRFLDALGDPAASRPRARLFDAFRRSLTRDGKMCLCGVLSAEIVELPPKVAHEARAFMTGVLDWLTASRNDLPAAERGRWAAETLAMAEGAMLLARSVGDDALFEIATAGLRADDRA